MRTATARASLVSLRRSPVPGPVRSWFEAKKKKDKDRGLGAVVAIMRKLALAVHATVTRDEPFLLARLLPGKPWRTPHDATNTNSKNNAVALKTSGIKKEETKKEETKKESHKPSTAEPRRRPRSRLPLQPLSLPLPT